MNKVLIMGRAVRDPEVKYTNDKKAVARLTLAVDRRFNKDEADFIPCVSFGKPAEFIEKYIKRENILPFVKELETCFVYQQIHPNG